MDSNDMGLHNQQEKMLVMIKMSLSDITDINLSIEKL